MREIGLLKCADALADSGFCNAEDVVSAGVDALVQSGLKAPQAHRIVNRAKTIASTTKYKVVPDHAVAGLGKLQHLHDD